MKAMTPPRFQFTHRGMLGATFWLALSMAAWALFVELARYGHQPGLVFYWAVTFLIVGSISPFVAIGALFRRSLLGAAIGFGFCAVVYLGFWLIVLRDLD
jgi:hypothetical protein